MLSRAAVPHMLAKRSWLLQCNGISILTCASRNAKVKASVGKHPTLEGFHPDISSPHVSLATAGHMATPASHRQRTVPPAWPEGKGGNQMQCAEVISTKQSFKLIINSVIPQIVQSLTETNFLCSVNVRGCTSFFEL